MSSITTKRVNNLKESLIKYQTKGDIDTHEEQILDILSQLDKCPMDLSVLAETLIGATVSKFKTNANTNIAVTAKTLVKKWKNLAKESGVGTNKSSSSTPSQSAAKPQSQPTSSSSNPSSAKTSVATTTNPCTKGSAVMTTNAFDHLEKNRKNSAEKLYDVFLSSKQSLLIELEDKDESTITQMMTAKAIEVEGAIQTFSRGRRKAYIEKIRSLIFNLKKNGPLRSDILKGNLTPLRLVSMSTKELQTAEKKRQQEKDFASLQGSRRLDWEQANADKVNEMCGIKGELLKASLFTCGRCKSHKTTSTQKQTRSADEPMTVFVFCENCGNRWKC